MQSASPALKILRRKECNADIGAPAAALYLSNASFFSRPCNLPLVTLLMIHHLHNGQGEDPSLSAL